MKNNIYRNLLVFNTSSKMNHKCLKLGLFTFSHINRSPLSVHIGAYYYEKYPIYNRNSYGN